MLSEGLVGRGTKASGPRGIRLDDYLNLIVADGSGRYEDLALNGELFISDSDSVTMAAANTTKTALATAKFINGFFNPQNSGKNAIIQSVNCSVVSGTATGPFVFNFIQGVTATNTVTGTIRNALLGGPSSGMTAETGVILTVSGGATTALVQCYTIGGPAASAVGAGIHSVTEDVAGKIVVPPGTLFGIMQVGAATAVVQTTLTWRERLV